MKAKCLQIAGVV